MTTSQVATGSGSGRAGVNRELSIASAGKTERTAARRCGAAANPAKACANESKKHVAGKPGTPYSVRVSGAMLTAQPSG